MTPATTRAGHSAPGVRLGRAAGFRLSGQECPTWRTCADLLEGDGGGRLPARVLRKAQATEYSEKRWLLRRAATVCRRLGDLSPNAPQRICGVHGALQESPYDAPPRVRFATSSRDT